MTIRSCATVYGDARTLQSRGKVVLALKLNDPDDRRWKQTRDGTQRQPQQLRGSCGNHEEESNNTVPLHEATAVRSRAPSARYSARTALSAAACPVVDEIDVNSRMFAPVPTLLATPHHRHVSRRFRARPITEFVYRRLIGGPCSWASLSSSAPSDRAVIVRMRFDVGGKESRQRLRLPITRTVGASASMEGVIFTNAEIRDTLSP